jgi:lysophospholipase L1-like esterase
MPAPPPPVILRFASPVLHFALHLPLDIPLTAVQRTLYVILMSLLGCHPPAKPAASNPFLALGDSYTIGQSVPASERWPVQLAAALRAEGVSVDDPQIIARTGWTTDELSAGIDAAELRGPYHLVTLLIGVNNQFRGRDINEFRTQFRELLKRAVDFAGGMPSRVIVVSIPDWGVTPFAEGRDRGQIGREIDAFNGVCREEAVHDGAAFVDITPGSRKAADDATLVADDGLHPSGKMYRQWVEQILPVARQAVGK